MEKFYNCRGKSLLGQETPKKHLLEVDELLSISHLDALRKRCLILIFSM
jgi:hypothetical protein